MTRRIGFSSLGLACLALFAPGPADVAASGRRLPDTIALPDGFQPEGIAVGRGAAAYVGSIPTGAIYRADLVSGRGSILVPPRAGRAAIGLEVDVRTNLLYVAGGPTGAAYVHDADTGEEVAAFQLTDEADTFVNDQIVVRDAVYFTDSRRPVLYRIALSAGGEPTGEVAEIPLGGDYVHIPGAFNANGIEAAPSGRELILVHSALGLLYRVDPDTGVAAAIDLGGATLPNGDGLLLRGSRLFVVQNRLNQIAVVALDRRLESGRVERLLTDPGFDVPTTVDSFAGAIYAVNARFGTPPAPDTTYTIERVSF